MNISYRVTSHRFNFYVNQNTQLVTLKDGRESGRMEISAVNFFVYLFFVQGEDLFLR